MSHNSRFIAARQKNNGVTYSEDFHPLSWDLGDMCSIKSIKSIYMLCSKEVGTNL